MEKEIKEIPKIIHYCWFGGNPLPEFAIKCINSWKEFFPDYEIIEWNEKNYDVHKNLYISQAYNSKKYAFVSDYARFDILYQYGGIYFDTDVEVIKSLDDVILNGSYAGIESIGACNAGLGIASFASNPIYLEVLESYNNSVFLNPNGSFNLETVVERFSKILEKYGFLKKNIVQHIAGITIYPIDYFCPINPATGVLKITENTRTIHHYAATWTIPIRKKYMSLRNSISSIVGIKLAKLILLPMQVICICKETGFKSLLKKIMR